MKKFGLLILIVLTTSWQAASAQNSARKVLPKNVNSALIECRPLISADGKTLFFSRKFHPQNHAGEKDLQDVWMTQRNERGLWESPVNVSFFNDSRENAVFSFNESEALYLHASTKRKHPLLRATKSGESWRGAETVEIGDYYNDSPYLDFYQSFEHNVLFLAVQRDDSRGGQDLYVSQKISDTQWSVPQSLGANVNSDGEDFAPFLSPDGKTLFFASYGHKGYGGADLFYITRQDESWIQWSDPVNLGSGVNSRLDEIFISVEASHNKGYIESFRSGSPVRDIMEVELPAELRPKEAEETEPMIAQTPSMQEPDAPLLASHDEELIEETRPASAAQQALSLELKTKWAHTSASQKALKILNNVYFDFNEASLDVVGVELLEKVKAYLASNNSARLVLEAYSDVKGGEDANMLIRKFRGMEVKNYLTAHGIDPNRIDIQYLHENRALATNDDETEGRELNRRVEMYLQQDNTLVSSAY